MRAADQSGKAVAYMANPSWCSATGTVNLAPALRKIWAQAFGSNADAMIFGMKSLYPKVSWLP